MKVITLIEKIILKKVFLNILIFVGAQKSSPSSGNRFDAGAMTQADRRTKKDLFKGKSDRSFPQKQTKKLQKISGHIVYIYDPDCSSGLIDIASNKI